VNKLAARYCKIPLLVYTIRPLWRIYDKIHHKHRQFIFRKRASIVLKTFASVCAAENIPFWLEFGTLLGAYREHGFIQHDFDLDIGVFYKDIDNLVKSLINNHFKMLRKFEVEEDSQLGIEFTFSYLSIPIDIFVFHKRNEEIYCHSFSPIFDNAPFEGASEVKEIIFPFTGITSINFANVFVGIPTNAKEHLILNYGDNFMTPDKNFDYRKTAKNIKYFTREQRLAKLT